MTGQLAQAWERLGWLTVGDLVAKAMGFAVTILLARRLAPTQFGRLSYAQAITGYLAIFVYFGLTTYGAREIVQAPSEASALWINITALRFVTAAMLVGALSVAFFATGFAPGERLVTIASATVLVPLAISPEWVAQGFSRMGTVAASRALARLSLLGLTVTLVRSGKDLLVGAFCRPLAELVGQAPLWWALIRLPLPGARIDRRRWGLYLTASLPLYASAFFSTVYSGGSDQILLRVSYSAATVGWYAAGYTIYAALGSLMALVSFAFLPLVAAAWGQTSGSFRRIVREQLAASMALALPASLALVLFANTLLKVAYGSEFVAATSALRLLAVSIPILGLGSVCITALIAMRRERWTMLVFGVGMFVNLGLNILLIRPFGMEGAAASTLISEAVVLLVALALLLRDSAWQP